MDFHTIQGLSLGVSILLEAKYHTLPIFSRGCTVRNRDNVVARECLLIFCSVYGNEFLATVFFNQLQQRQYLFATRG